MSNPKVFFDIAINNENIGRIVMEVSLLLSRLAARVKLDWETSKAGTTAKGSLPGASLGLAWSKMAALPATWQTLALVMFFF